MRYRLFLMFFICGFSVSAFSQSKPVLRREAVERNLIPYVPIQGFPAWNIQERMQYYRIPGASVAIIKGYKIEWAKGYGLADTIKKLPVTTNTLFSAGSISKLVTAVIALRLVEQGKLSLDSPINRYLKFWKLKENDFTRKRQITLRMLLSHTGGTSQSAYFGYLPTKRPLPSVVQVLNGDSIAEVNPVVVNSEPGKEFRYSGGGYMVVQQAIMDVLKKDFAQIALTEIFEPLGMHHSTFLQPLQYSFARQAAWGYSAASWYKGTPYVYPQQAAAGLYSTPTDLALLLIEIQKCYTGKGKLLSTKLAKAMLKPIAIVSKGVYLEEIGLGVFLLEQTGTVEANSKYFGHEGVNAGFMAFATGSVEGGNGVVIMINSGDDFNGFSNELRRSVARVYRWTNFLPPTLKPVKLSNEMLESYVGRYRKSEDEVLTLRKEGNYLVENINEGRDIYCFPVSMDTIVFTDFSIKGFFSRDSSGAIVALRNEYQTKKDAMPRMHANEFTPSEHLKAKRYAQAKEGLENMMLNEYQITSIAYDRLHQTPFDPQAVQALLEVAIKQHPTSAIVYSRWGDFFKVIGDKENAIKNYRKSLEIEPGDKNVIENLHQLK